MSCPICGKPLDSIHGRCAACDANASSRAPGPETIAAAGPELPPLGAGAAFGRFILVRSLGAGGMGVVWQAWDPELDRAVAVKVIRREDSPAASVERFLREARLAAQLRHPGIVRVHDVGEIDGRHFIAMDYVEGKTLEEHWALARTATLAVGDAAARRLREDVALLAEISEAVGFAHAQGIIHRDLKPANVMLDDQGRPHVMDFGLAKQVFGGEEADVQKSRLLTLSGQALGTPAYMSPEQACSEGDRLCPATDVWALGVMLYQVLAGRFPFVNDEVTALLQAIADDDPKPPGAAAPGVPAELEIVCLRALEKDPRRRYADAAAFAAELRRWLRGERIETRAVGARERALRWMSRRRRTLAAICAALALASAVLSWAAYERERSRARAAAQLADIAAAVARFEDQALRTEMPDESRSALAAQPFDLLAHLIDDDPHCGAAFAWRGRVQTLLGHFVEAHQDFAQACALAPESATVWRLTGTSLLDTYAAHRGLPMVHTGSAGPIFEPMRPDAPAEQEWRESGLTALGRALEQAERDPAFDAADIAEGRAQAAVFSGRPERLPEALVVLREVERPRAWSLKGRALYLTERFDEAIVQYDRTLAEWLADDVTRELRGLARIAAGSLAAAQGGDPRAHAAAAIDDFGRVISHRPAYASAWHERASAWLLQAGAESARGVDPRTSLANADADYARSLALDPECASTHVNLAIVCRRLGEAMESHGEDAAPAFRAGIAHCDEALRLTPIPNAFVDRATLLQALGAWEATHGVDPRETFRRAIADAGRALDGGGDRAVAQGVRGLAFCSLGQAEAARGIDPAASAAAAIADLSASLGLRPAAAAVHGNRATAHRLLGNWAAEHGRDPHDEYRLALADQDEALRLDPSSAIAWSNRGTLHAKIGEFDAEHGRDPRPEFAAACADFGKALEVNPEYLPAYHNRGNVERQRGELAAAAGRDPSADFGRAIADYDAVLKRNPENVAALNCRAATSLEIGMQEGAAGRDPRPSFERARADLDAALARNPREAMAWHNRALARQQLARLDAVPGRDPRDGFRAAIEDLDAALRLHADWTLALVSRAGVHQDLAQIELEQGRDPSENLRGALADLDRTLQLNPDLMRVHIDRARVWIALGEAERKAGRESADAWTHAEADLAAVATRAADPRARAALAVDRYNYACVLARVPGDAALRARALDQLEEAFRLGFADRDHMRVDPDLAALREEPRFRALVGR